MMQEGCLNPDKNLKHDNRAYKAIMTGILFDEAAANKNGTDCMTH